MMKAESTSETSTEQGARPTRQPSSSVYSAFWVYSKAQCKYITFLYSLEITKFLVYVLRVWPIQLRLARVILCYLTT